MKLNKLMITARLGKDPEGRDTSGGTRMAKLRCCGTRRVKRGEQWEDAPVWFDAVVFGRRAETLEKHFKKGDQIFLEGELDFDEWDAKDGSGKRSKLSMYVSDWDFLGGGGAGGDEGGGRKDTPW